MIPSFSERSVYSKLTDYQRRIVDGMKRAVVDKLSDSGRFDAPRGGRHPCGRRTYPPENFKLPRWGNALALLGPRGAGKTTMLVALWEKLREDQNRRDCCERVFVTSPIDLALAQPTAPLGLSVLTEVRKQILDSSNSPADEQEENDFQRLSRAYFYADDAYRQLLSGRAGTAQQYAAEAARAIPQRFELPHHVDAWAQTVRRFSGGPIVVLLDDVDLMQETSLIRELVRSLLDELHQPRLIFVLAADQQGLELGASADGSPAAVSLSRSLLLKILALRDRYAARQWDVNQRLEFRAATQEDGNRDTQQSPEAPPPLGALLAQHWAKARGDASQTTSGKLLEALLPPWPRGLENLHQLWSHLSPEVGNTRLERELLSALATSRGEPSWGNRLLAVPAEHWGRNFIWAEEAGATSQTALARLAEAAASDDALWGVVPQGGALPIDPERFADGDVERWHELMLELALAQGSVSPYGLVRRWPLLSGASDHCALQRRYTWDALEQHWRKAWPEAGELEWQHWSIAGGGSILALRSGPWEWVQGANGLRRLEPPMIDRLSIVPSATAANWSFLRGNAADWLPKNVRALILFCHALRELPWERLNARVDETPPRLVAVAALGWTAAAIQTALGWARGGSVAEGESTNGGADAWTAPLAILGALDGKKDARRDDLPEILSTWAKDNQPLPEETIQTPTAAALAASVEALRKICKGAGWIASSTEATT